MCYQFIDLTWIETPNLDSWFESEIILGIGWKKTKIVNQWENQVKH